MLSLFHDVLINFIMKFFEWIANLIFTKQDRRRLLRELDEYAVTFESTHDGTIVADGIFHLCLRSHKTIEKIVTYVWDASNTREQEASFLTRLHSELLQQLQDRTGRTLTRSDVHTVRVFLEEILNRVKEGLADKTPLNQREIRYRLQQTEAIGARIEEKIDHLIRKESEDQPKGCEVPCDDYRSVKISVKLPTLENARYYLQYVRAGKDDWDHKGALENTRYRMVPEVDGIFSVFLEKIPINLGFQFKCYAQCKTVKDTDAVYQKLREHFSPLYRSSRFPEYQNGRVYVSDVNGRKSEFALVDYPVAGKRRIWFILPEYHPYVTGDKDHPFLNNYYHHDEEFDDGRTP